MNELRQHNFASIVKEKLKACEKSIRWLALRAGMNDSYLSQLLREKVENPSLDIALRVFIALKIDPTDYARAAGYLPPFDRENLPENLQIAMRRDDWPHDVKPYEIEGLVTWGLVSEGKQGLHEISPAAYRDLLEELRGKPIQKIEQLMSGAPLHIQEQCVRQCRMVINDWRAQEKPE